MKQENWLEGYCKNSGKKQYCIKLRSVKMENGGWVEDVLETGTTYTLHIDIIWTVILKGLKIMALYWCLDT